MNTPHYAYCPNPQCSHEEQDQSPYIEQGEITANRTCPHCGTPLRLSCPQCGKAIGNPPQRFCPACGSELLDPPADKPCHICGRPVAVPEKGCKEVPICSDQCLRCLIEVYIKVCDQCGSRFVVENPTLGGAGSREYASDMGAELDFCSPACRKKYLATAIR